MLHIVAARWELFLQNLLATTSREARGKAGDGFALVVPEKPVHGHAHLHHGCPKGGGGLLCRCGGGLVGGDSFAVGGGLQPLVAVV